MCFAATRDAPYLLVEGSERLRAKADEANREKAVEKSRRLEEALAKEAAVEEHEDDDNKPTEAAA